MKRIIFGFDLGVASIGWAIIEYDDGNFDPETGEIVEGKIIACGVRCFPVAENPKDGSSLATPRRDKRLLRRIIRRKARRMLGIKRLFVARGLATSVKELEQTYAAQTGGDVWHLRVKALDKELTREELVRVLTHLAKHRGFRSYRKAVEEADKEGGKVLQAIKKNQDDVGQNRTLAEMIVNRAKNSAICKMRNYTAKDSKNKDIPFYINSIPREKIIEETKLIFDAQKKYGLFTESLYNDFCRIAFRFREAEADGVGKMVGKCRFEANEPRAPKEAPSAELFVAESKINNMRIIIDGERRFLTKDERATLLELLKNTKEVKYSTIRSKMFKGREISFEDVDYNRKSKKNKKGEDKTINPEDSKFYSMKGWHKLKEKFSPEDWSIVSQNIPLLDIGMTAVACEKSDNGIENYLKEKGVEAKYREVFKKLNSREFINLSLKALYKINPYMAEGMKYAEACEKAGYDFRDNGNKLADKKGVFLPPIAADKQTTVPVVNRTVAQLRKVYNAMVRTYGMPDQINLEVGRELRKTHDERNQIKQRQNQYAEERLETVSELEKMKIPATGKNILKYQLYQQQHGKCIYSNNPIEIKRLDEDGYCEVDHIIPYSRSLDNSINNKVLCFTEENQKKGNKTPFEYLKPLGRWDEFKTIITNTQSLGKKKRDNLLNEDYAKHENDIEFRERNANDNSHIARYVKQYLEDAVDFSASSCPIKQRIQVRTGSLTDYLRHQWGLSKDRNKSDKHHAQDAIVLACATQGMVQKLSRLSAIFENKEEFRKKKAAELGQEKEKAWYTYIKKQIQEPWVGFRNEVLDNLDKIFVSRPPRKNATGSAHKDTLYPKDKGKGSLPVRNGLTEKENMFRLDVFEKNSRYYVVPIYVVDLIDHKQFKDIPQPFEYVNESIIAIDESFQFRFSLYKDDYIQITSGGETYMGYLNQYNAQSGQFYIGSVDNSEIYRINTSTFTIGEHILIRKEEKEYVGKIGEFDKETQTVSIEELPFEYELTGILKKNKRGEDTKNIQLCQSYIKVANEKKISISVINNLKKYQVDPLGLHITEVKKETRLPLTMIKKKHPCDLKKGK